MGPVIWNRECWDKHRSCHDAKSKWSEWFHQPCLKNIGTQKKAQNNTSYIFKNIFLSDQWSIAKGPWLPMAPSPPGSRWRCRPVQTTLAEIHEAFHGGFISPKKFSVVSLGSMFFVPYFVGHPFLFGTIWIQLLSSSHPSSGIWAKSLHVRPPPWWFGQQIVGKTNIIWDDLLSDLAKRTPKIIWVARFLVATKVPVRTSSRSPHEETYWKLWGFTHPEKSKVMSQKHVVIFCNLKI